MPDPSAFAAPEGETRRKKKQRDLIKPEPLSINSLMDIMTILLVFDQELFFDPVTLKQTEDFEASVFKFAIEARSIDDDDTHPQGSSRRR